MLSYQLFILFASIAQSVEQLIRNQQVAGSSPVTSSNFSVTKVTEFFDFRRGLLMGEKEYRALRSALASTRMEGFEVTEQTEKDCIRLLSGDISVADLVKEIVSRPAKAVCYGIQHRPYFGSLLSGNFCADQQV